MESRSWHWLATRVRGLLNHPTRKTRIAAALSTTTRGGYDGA